MANKPTPTAAETELAQREGREGEDDLANRAKDERKTQRQELKHKGLTSPGDAGDTPSEQHRSDHVQLLSKTSGDRPDQLTVTNPQEEPFYGHFVTVVKGDDEGAFGVYESNSTFKENGKPDVVNVRLRGSESHLIQVRYDDLRPAESRGNAPR